MSPVPLHPLLLAVLHDAGPIPPWPPTDSATEWPAIVDQAATHGLAPLLARWLARLPAGCAIPPAVAERLESQCAAITARNMLLAEELVAILRAADTYGIRCAPLRGLALAERLYGDIALRPMGDVDLLVDKRDLPALTGILGTFGFRQFDRRPGFAHAFSYTGEFFKDRHGPVVVEPHWTITYPPARDRIDLDRVWRCCRRGTVLGIGAWLLGTEALLLHLCLHVVHREPGAPYLWIYDIDRLIRKEGAGLDWTEFVDLASTTGLATLVAQVLARARAELDAPIPDGVLDRLGRTRTRRFERRLNRLLGPTSGVDGKESLALLLTLDGVAARLRCALALLFPAPEFMMSRYGLTRRAQLGPAYVRRVSRFSWEGMKGVVRLLV